GGPDHRHQMATSEPGGHVRGRGYQQIERARRAHRAQRFPPRGGGERGHGEKDGRESDPQQPEVAQPFGERHELAPAGPAVASERAHLIRTWRPRVEWGPGPAWGPGDRRGPGPGGTPPR